MIGTCIVNCQSYNNDKHTLLFAKDTVVINIHCYLPMLFAVMINIFVKIAVLINNLCIVICHKVAVMLNIGIHCYLPKLQY